MVNNEFSTTFAQEHGHVQESLSWEGWKVESLWLFSSVAVCSLFVFTLLAALSTSFYCCDKTRKKEDSDVEKETSYSEETQKLFFPDVPSNIYPTTQSILQQEDNEVVESLSLAYRELPSIHPNYGNTNDSSLNMSETQYYTQRSYNHSTTYPESTRSSRNSHTSPSLSSEERLKNYASDTHQSSDVSPTQDITTTMRSQSAPAAASESDIFIRVQSLRNSQACVTSSTSGVVTGYDMTSRSMEESSPLENTESLKNTDFSSKQRLSGTKSVQANSSCYSTEPVVVNQTVIQDEVMSLNDRYAHRSKTNKACDTRSVTKQSRSNNDSGFVQENNSFEKKRGCSPPSLLNSSYTSPKVHSLESPVLLPYSNSSLSKPQSTGQKRNNLYTLPKAQYVESPVSSPHSNSPLTKKQFTENLERNRKHLAKKHEDIERSCVEVNQNHSKVFLDNDTSNRGASSFGDIRLNLGRNRVLTENDRSSSYDNHMYSDDSRVIIDKNSFPANVKDRSILRDNEKGLYDDTRATSLYDDRVASVADRLSSDINRLLSEDTNYYSLTFDREASLLSEQDGGGDSMMRGASAFGGKCSAFGRKPSAENRTNLTSSRRNRGEKENYESRGASVFGAQSNAKTKQQKYPRRANIDTAAENIGRKVSNMRSFTTSENFKPRSRLEKNEAVRVTNDFSRAKLSGNETRDNKEPMSNGSQPQEKYIIGTKGSALRGASELRDNESRLVEENDYNSLFESVSLSFAYESPTEEEVTSR